MKGQKVIIISEDMTGCGVWDTVICLILYKSVLESCEMRETTNNPWRGSVSSMLGYLGFSC